MAEDIIIKSKEIFYRGKSLDFLKTLEAREVAKYLPSRSRRSILRNFQLVEKFIKRCETNLAKKNKIRTHLRDIVVLPKLVGMTIGVHNGRTFNDVTITNNMIGHRLGEFSFTRQKVQHGAPGIGATKSSAGVQKT